MQSNNAKTVGIRYGARLLHLRERAPAYVCHWSGWLIPWVCDPFDVLHGNCWEVLVPPGFYSFFCIVGASTLGAVCRQELDYMLQDTHVLHIFFYLWLHDWRGMEQYKARACQSLSFSPCSTHLLMVFISPLPLPPYTLSLFPHVPVFISLPLSAWFCLSGEWTGTGRQTETEIWTDGEKERDGKREMRTEMDGGMEAGRGICLSRLKGFVVVAGPLAMLILAKCIWSDDSQWGYVTVYMLLVFLSFLIPLSSKSLSSLSVRVFKPTVGAIFIHTSPSPLPLGPDLSYVLLHPSFPIIFLLHLPLTPWWP